CLAEPAVLELKILQALHLLALQPAKLLAPPIIVTSLTPIWRIASTMFWPCETRTSTCRSFATISSGLYRFLAIAVLLDVKDIPQVGPLQWGWITGALFAAPDPVRAFQMEFADLPTSLVGQIINHLAYPLFFVQRHARHRYRFFFSKACSTSRRMASGREGRSSWWALQASSFSSRSG